MIISIDLELFMGYCTEKISTFREREDAPALSPTYIIIRSEKTETF